MSKQLNALFAEKVLGWYVYHWEEEDAWFWYPKNSKDGWHLPKGDEFTTSLDAAWRGVKKNPSWCVEIVRDRTLDTTVEIDVLSVVEGQSSCGWTVCAAAAIPALALVKACLLAVGVSQDEIDKAEHG